MGVRKTLFAVALATLGAGSANAQVSGWSGWTFSEPAGPAATGDVDQNETNGTTGGSTVPGAPVDAIFGAPALLRSVSAINESLLGSSAEKEVYATATLTVGPEPVCLAVAISLDGTLLLEDTPGSATVSSLLTITPGVGGLTIPGNPIVRTTIGSSLIAENEHRFFVVPPGVYTVRAELLTKVVLDPGGVFDQAVSDFFNGSKGMCVILRDAGPIPVTATVLGTASEIGSTKVSTAGPAIRARFDLDPAFAYLDDWYNFRWVNVVVGHTINGVDVDADSDGNPDHALVGELPAIDPAPAGFGNGDDDKPFYLTDAEFALLHTEGVESNWIDNRSTGAAGTKVITFRTYLVVQSVTDPTLGAKQFCVLPDAFEWTSTMVNGGPSVEEVTLTIIAPDLAEITTALGNAEGLGFPGWTAIAGHDLTACFFGVPPEDSCPTPRILAGQSAWVFDTTQATTGPEGQNESLCYAFGLSAIDGDVWFDWTADATGTASVRTCSGTAFDTKLAAYPGSGCPAPGTSLDCNDDFCGLQSTLNFPVIGGTNYTLQVGSFPGTSGGPGVLEIAINTGSMTHDDCATPQAIAGQGGFPYDNNSATTGLEGQTEALCYAFGTSGIDDDLWFEWTADAGGFATVSTCFSTHDSRLAAYPAGACPTAGSALACNDDSCGLQSEMGFAVTNGTSYLLQVGNFPGAAGGSGLLDIAIGAPPGAGTAYCFCDGSGGSAPCSNFGGNGNGCANGFDLNGANLIGVGSPQVSSDSLVLSASGLAPNQPGLYFQGTTQVSGGAGIAFGDGLRCAGGQVIRLGVAFADGAGTSSTASLVQPISVKGAVLAGDTRDYQLWYRDPQGSPCATDFNLTNGFEVVWGL